MTPITYSYKSPFALVTLIIPIVFGFTTFHFISLANSPSAIFTYKHVARLSHNNSIIAFWGGAMFSMCLSLIGLLLFINHLITTKSIILNKHEITCPSLMSFKPAVIPYSQILDLKIQKIHSNNRAVKDALLMHIFTANKKFTFSSLALSSEKDLLDMYNIISQKTAIIPSSFKH